VAGRPFALPAVCGRDASEKAERAWPRAGVRAEHGLQRASPPSQGASRSRPGRDRRSGARLDHLQPRQNRQNGLV